MRYQGKIANWKDDQGFGFVIPNGDGPKAFVYIKAFSKGTHRPNVGDVITYELVTDKRGRFVAKNIHFAGEVKTNTALSSASLFGTYVVITFCLLMALLVLLDRDLLPVAWVYLCLSSITFVAYAIDKSAAKNDRWRTKETTLHVLSLMGGWPGAFLAQKTLRHKSKKHRFQNIFWVTVMANGCIVG